MTKKLQKNQNELTDDMNVKRSRSKSKMEIKNMSNDR